MLLFPEPSVHRSRRCDVLLLKEDSYEIEYWLERSFAGASVLSLVFFHPWPGRVSGVSFRGPESDSSRPHVKCALSVYLPPITVSIPGQTSSSCASLSGCHLSATFLFPRIFLDPRGWKVPYPRSRVGTGHRQRVTMFA